MAIKKCTKLCIIHMMLLDDSKIFFGLETFSSLLKCKTPSKPSLNIEKMKSLREKIV